MSEDGQTFHPSYRRNFSTIESHLYFEEDLSKDDICDPIQNWISGCKCKDEFAALKCKRGLQKRALQNPTTNQDKRS